MENPAKEIEGISVADVAKALNTTPVNVLLLLKRGLLSGQEVDGVWYVGKESFAAFREKPIADQGPAPCRSACSRASQCGSCDH